MINFDMIGRNETDSAQTNGLRQIAKDTSNELNLIGAKYSPDYRATVEAVNQSAGLKLNYKWDEEPFISLAITTPSHCTMCLPCGGLRASTPITIRSPTRWKKSISRGWKRSSGWPIWPVFSSPMRRLRRNFAPLPRRNSAA